MKNNIFIIWFFSIFFLFSYVFANEKALVRLKDKTDFIVDLAVSDEEMNIPYVVGESVKVVDGPFNNFNGVIENINEEKKKLTVMVKIFGRKTPLELNYMQVEKDG